MFCLAERNGRPAAILFEMERLPEQHGIVVQAPEEREEFHGRDTGVRRTDVQGTQNGVVGLQPIFQSLVGGKYTIHVNIIMVFLNWAT